jgi:hypothetical protein
MDKVQKPSDYEYESSLAVSLLVGRDLCIGENKVYG